MRVQSEVRVQSISACINISLDPCSLACASYHTHTRPSKPLQLSTCIHHNVVYRCCAYYVSVTMFSPCLFSYLFLVCCEHDFP